MNAPVVSKLARAMIERFARLYRLELEDVTQEYQLICIELADSFDPGRGAARETYYINSLEIRCKQLAAQARYGISLDEEQDEDGVFAVDRVQAVIAEAAAARSEDVSEGWRYAETDDALERLESFGELYMRIARLAFLDGKTKPEIADILSLTTRRVSQVIREVTLAFRAGDVPIQQSLLGHEFDDGSFKQAAPKPAKKRKKAGATDVLGGVTAAQLALI